MKPKAYKENYKEDYKEYPWKIKRILIDTNDDDGNYLYNNTSCYSTFDKALKALNKMYHHDKACWEYLCKYSKDEMGQDEKFEYTSYSFTLSDRHLIVKIVDVDEEASRVFGY